MRLFNIYRTTAVIFPPHSAISVKEPSNDYGLDCGK